MQGDLFDTAPAVTTRAPKSRAPAWVIDELVSKHGILRATAEKWPANQAFAVLHRCRLRRDPRLKIEARKKELAAALATAATTDDVGRDALSDLVAEALALIDAPEAAAVARCVAEQLGK